MSDSTERAAVHEALAGRRGVSHVVAGDFPHHGPRQGCPLCPVLPRVVAIEPGGPLLAVPPPAGVTRGEVDELGGVAVASRRA
jgi:hypothetical protein